MKEIQQLIEHDELIKAVSFLELKDGLCLGAVLRTDLKPVFVPVSILLEKAFPALIRLDPFIYRSYVFLLAHKRDVARLAAEHVIDRAFRDHRRIIFLVIDISL